MYRNCRKGTDKNVPGVPASDEVGRSRSILVWLLITAGTIFPYAGIWLSGRTIVHRDTLWMYAPTRWMIGEALRGGRLPLWNPYNATGMPYFAELLHGTLHPLSVAAAFLCPADSVEPLLGAYLVSGAVGAALFARTLGVSLPATALAAFAYGLAGYPLSMGNNLCYLAGASGVPWILAGLRVAGRDRTAVSFALASLAVAAGALSGEVQALLVTVPCGLVLALDAGRWRGLLLASAACCVGSLLAGIQLAPAWSFFPLSNRILPLPGFDLNQWDLSPWRLIEFIVPGFFWSPEEGYPVAPVFKLLGYPTWFNVPFTESVYLGAGTMLLAFAGLRSSRTTRILATLSILVLWMALGRHFGFRSLQNLLPVAKGFRYGEKFLPFFLAAVSALAAVGMDRVTRGITAARSCSVWFGFTALILAALFLVVFFGGPGWYPGDTGGAAAIRGHLLCGLPHAVIITLLIFICLRFFSGGKGRVAIVTIVWGSLVVAAYYAVRPGSPEARLRPTPTPLAAKLPGPRVYNVVEPLVRKPVAGWNLFDQLFFDYGSSLAPDTNVWNRTDNLSVDAGIYPLRWFRLSRGIDGGFAQLAPRYGTTHLLFLSPRSERGRRLAAEYTAGGLSRGKDLRNLMEVWEIPHRPWAVFPESVTVVPDTEVAFQRVLHSSDLLGRNVTIEADEPFSASPGRVISLQRGTEQIEVMAESSGQGTLVINDAFWPGWRAFIDGRETVIFPADALVRAVHWPAGRHQLVMRYDPPEFRVGIKLSLCGMFLLGAGCFLLRRNPGWGRGADAAGDTSTGRIA